MSEERVIEFLKHHHHAILATTRANGDAQLSPVLAVADDDGRILISTREGAIKTKNARKRPRAAVCIFTDRFFGEFVQVTGPVEIISLPNAMELLVDYYRRAAGEHDNWSEYRAAMQQERRCILRVTPEVVGPTVQG